jgi:hypothetical protein
MNGFKASSLTAQDIIAYLEAMMLADGVVNVSTGVPSAEDTTILNGAWLDLETITATSSRMILSNSPRMSSLT